ncbi:Family with sequence similarity 76, member [Nesidiocoris tenuis]|uniref:Family with sequence similarity 76, member n=1 Tax=Nesidiocoris tenuis TaxID=355587 RepID=A0ABN7AU34_9HEMI|nr:Family with sequence similarity 76, member [Nesidiocoris tenuis]
MSGNVALFACSKCFTKHPFEELSSGQQLCKDCRGAFPVVKCTYCRSEFQQTNKVSTSTICNKCEHNVKQFGKPTACEYCNIIAAFIGNRCQRCHNSERRYGPPVTCEQCKQKCAFDRKDDDKKVDGKLLCWLCTLSYKRALAKTKQGDADRRAQLKLAAQRSSKTREPRMRSHNKRPNRVDVTKVDVSRLETSESGAVPPPAKVARAGNHRPPGDLLDPNSSDHVVAMTQLKEQMASMQKQLSIKDSLLLSKDKTITELKAAHFTAENEIRNRMLNEKKEADFKVDHLTIKVKTLQKEIASLKKSNKRNSKKDNSRISINSSAVTDGEGDGTRSGGGGGSGGSGTDSPLP